MVYLLFYIYNFIAALINDKKVYIFTLIIFILLFGLRYQVGVDWWMYERYFYDYSIVTYEIGFKVLNQLISLIFNNFQALIFISFIIVAISYFSNVIYFTPNYNIAIMAWLGVGFLSFGVLRQSIAIALFFYALRFTSDKKKIYLFIILIASAFHSTAIGLIPLLIFIDKNASRKKYIGIILIALTIYFLNIDTAIIYMMSKIPILGTKVLHYINNAEYFGGSLGLGVRFIEAMLLFLICTWYKPILEKKYKYFNKFYNLLVIYIFFYLSFNEVGSISARFIKYFELSHIILFSYLIGLFENKHLRLIFIFMIFLYFGLRYYTTITGAFSLQSNIKAFLPYNNYLIEILKLK